MRWLDLNASFTEYVPLSVVCHGNETSSDAINSTVRSDEHRRKWLAVAERKVVGILFYLFVFGFQTEYWIQRNITRLARIK